MIKVGKKEFPGRLMLYFHANEGHQNLFNFQAQPAFFRR